MGPGKEATVFEDVRLALPGPRRISLHTHLGNEIENEIAVHPVPQHAIDKFNRIAGQHPRWIHRKPPTGIYNCFGHVWASRRTAVYEKFDEAVLKVREDDGYRTVDWERETPAVGDIACYWESVNPYRDCSHVGLVVSVQPQGKELPPVIWILSKWDDTTGEVVHEASDHIFKGVRVEYWTDRPLDRPRTILT
jgi:hypothetical protein